jgi:hypothetical protein
MPISDQKFEELKAVINTTIHELVAVCSHMEDNEIEDACQCLMTCQGNLDRVAEELVKHEPA